MENLNSIIWFITICFLIVVSLYYLKLTNFIVFKIGMIYKTLKKDKSKDSSIKALFMSLAAKIGVGSIAGIALAIRLGGPGTIFWMWLITLITSITTFVESVLGVKYKQKDICGPSCYIKNNKLSKLYSILLILIYIVGFNTIQSNSIVKLFSNIYNTSNVFIGTLIVIFTYLIIRKGNKYIVNFISKLVPIMTFIYVFMCIVIIYINVDRIPGIFKSMIDNALNIKSISVSTIIIGIQRGVFSSEVGTGTGAIAASLSNSRNSVKVAFIQTIGVLFTTFIICTFTALIVLMIDYNNIGMNLNGIELTNISVNKYLGNFGTNLLLIVIILFAFSTIISGYYFAENTYITLNNNKFKNNKNLFMFISLIIIFLGSIVKSKTLWILADILLGIMTIINLCAIIKRKNELLMEINRGKYDRKQLG